MNNEHIGTGIRYRPEIDGLRAVAVLGVVVFHAFPKNLPGGYVGVDVFFVISGFLITSIILNDLSSGGFSLVTFYGRRIRRIVPSLAATLLIVLLLGWFLLVAGEFEALGKEVVSGSAFLANLSYYASTGYFDRGKDAKYLLNLWSLAIEEQFYLVWPILLLALAKRGLSVARATIALAALSLFACLIITYIDASLAFYMPFTRFWELLAGGVLAILVHKGGGNLSDLPTSAGRILSTAGIMIIVGTFFLFDRDSAFPGWRAIIPVVGAALVVLAATTNSSNPILASKPMVRLGLVSYPLYLVHWPLLVYAKTIAVFKVTAFSRWAVLAISLLLAVALYRHLEKPIRNSPNFGKVVLNAALSAVFLIGTGALLQISHGMPSRWAANFSSDVAAYQRAQKTPPFHQISCALDQAAVRAKCYSIADIDVAKIAVVGDSHSGEIHRAITANNPSYAPEVLWIGGPACPFTIGFERGEDCGNGDGKKVYEFLKKQPNIETVVFASRWTIYSTNVWFGMEDEDWERPKTTLTKDRSLSEVDKIVEESLVDTIKAYQAVGKRVVILINAPDMNFHPSRCVSRPLRAAPAECSISVDSNRARFQVFNNITTKLQNEFPKVVVYDASNLFCNEARCKARLPNGEFLYRDDNHLTVIGASMVFEDLRKKLSTN